MSVRGEEPKMGEPLGRRTVVRQFSLWPFGNHSVQLYLLIHPSTRNDQVEEVLLRSMQAEFFRTESRSQTRALRQCVLAANYVLQSYNQDALPHERVYASAACAVVRGSTAYAVLAGETAAFALLDNRLASQRSVGRVARPLGLEGQPKVAFWSAELSPGDRLALACGTAWQDSTLDEVARLMADLSLDRAESALAQVLAGPDGPARSLVAEPDITNGPTRLPRTPRLMFQNPIDVADSATRAARAGAVPAKQHSEIPSRTSHGPRRTPTRSTRPARRFRRLARPIAAAVALAALLVAGTFALGQPLGEPPHSAWAREAETLLQQAEQTRDAFKARDLAAQAAQLASRAASAEPSTYTPLLSRAQRALQDADRAYLVHPSAVVDVGGRAPGIADVAVGADQLYALDVQRAEVRQFSLARTGQRWDDGQVVATRGTNAGSGTVDAPVAMAWVRGEVEGLTLIDQTGRISLFNPRGGLRLLAPLGGPAWRSVSAVSQMESAFCVLDGQSGAYYVYPVGPTGPAGAPRMTLTANQAPELASPDVVEMVAGEDLFLRTSGGSVVRLDRQGQRRPFAPRVPGGDPGPFSSLAPDRTGGLYAADPANERVVHLTGDGRFVRQLRAGDGQSLAGIRSLQTSLDGRRLMALVGTNLVSISLPAEVPVPLEATTSETAEPSETQIVK